MAPATLSSSSSRARARAAPGGRRRPVNAHSHSRSRPSAAGPKRCRIGHVTQQRRPPPASPRARPSSVACRGAVVTPQVWLEWSGVAFAGIFGLFLERNGNRLVKTLSAPLLATMAGLVLTNCGLTPASSPVYGIVNRFLLPLAVPMLLLSADIRKVLGETKRLLGVFLIGSFATCAATIATFKLVPLAALGAEESWKVASALASRHIGGAVNFIAVAQTLEISGDAVAAALAADNLICALYFMAIFYITRNVGPEESDPASGAGAQAKEEDLESSPPPIESESEHISTYKAGLAVCFSSLVCGASAFLATSVLGRPGVLIPIATLITVVIATCFPNRMQEIASAGEGMSLLIMQFFFATVGMSGAISKVLTMAPLLFVFSFLQVAIHLALILLIGRSKIFNYSLKEVILASNANVGGPTTAAAMCAAKQWRSYFVPSMLSGILGYSIATFVSIAMGYGVLKPLAMKF